MKVEGSRGAVPVKRRRREAAAGGRNGGGGVSVRRRRGGASRRMLRRGRCSGGCSPRAVSRSEAPGPCRRRRTCLCSEASSVRTSGRGHGTSILHSNLTCSMFIRQPYVLFSTHRFIGAWLDLLWDIWESHSCFFSLSASQASDKYKIGPEDVRKFLDAITDTPGPHHSHPIITRTTVYSCRNFSPAYITKSSEGCMRTTFMLLSAGFVFLGDLQIVIFFLPPKAVIPLHNHPGMTVFSKLLFGSLHVRSYDWVHPDDRLIVTAGNESTNPRNRDSTLPAVKLARLVLDADLSAPCDALVLYPESGGNMHQFAAATPCAVLDVLGPPYSKDRDCTYYQDLPFSNHDPSVDDNDAGDVDATDEKNARLAWLKETDKPQDLKMYEVPYKGPPPIF
ncbi:hypothetical protein PR202_ga12869 [Eleusine coracana subsp. coracana]|uniref:cysteine dioxygenase n=1 Tax=Eleusine coracana subsp. coracana TaxID=191504 RepID=A0AAV5CDC3_ELECO|nr:hypothetical protein PR202_ga12869 [Eleusine coracana subsp. coracana]